MARCAPMIGFRDVSVGDLPLQHSVAVAGCSGSAQVQVEVRVSAGRDGFGPELALGYDSGAGNSPFGLGWSLSGVPAIGIDTRRGIPTYVDDEDSYVYAGGDELVPYQRMQGTAWRPVVGSDGDWAVYRYRSRVERSFDRFERRVHKNTGRVHWRRYTGDGVVHVFGAADDGSTRIGEAHTFAWLLEASYDPRGNA